MYCKYRGAAISDAGSAGVLVLLFFPRLFDLQHAPSPPPPFCSAAFFVFLVRQSVSILNGTEAEIFTHVDQLENT